MIQIYNKASLCPILLTLVISVLTSCTTVEIVDLPPPMENASSFSDSDKGNNISSYHIVPIGNQIWMAENLNYNVPGSKCYGEGNNNYTSTAVQANCDKYGRLYDWATAMALSPTCNSNTCASLVQAKHKGICPSGWHIPTNAEWDELINAVGGPSAAGKHLKAISGWYSNGNGLDSDGFAALPSGFGRSDGIFLDAGIYSYWWSSSEVYDGHARDCYMNEDESVHRSNGDKTYLQSVRCVKD